ncbi:hypothetical protein Tco_0312964 [Tanacetum coccineum]
MRFHSIAGTTYGLRVHHHQSPCIGPESLNKLQPSPILIPFCSEPVYRVLPVERLEVFPAEGTATACVTHLLHQSPGFIPESDLRMGNTVEDDKEDPKVDPAAIRLTVETGMYVGSYADDVVGRGGALSSCDLLLLLIQGAIWRLHWTTLEGSIRESKIELVTSVDQEDEIYIFSAISIDASALLMEEEARVSVPLGHSRWMLAIRYIPRASYFGYGQWSAVEFVDCRQQTSRRQTVISDCESRLSEKRDKMHKLNHEVKATQSTTPLTVADHTTTSVTSAQLQAMIDGVSLAVLAGRANDPNGDDRATSGTVLRRIRMHCSEVA